MSVLSPHGGQRLRLARWLIWRIAKFNKLHPEIEVRLVVTGTMIDLAHSDIDAGIRCGRGSWPGVTGGVGGAVRATGPVAAPPVASCSSHPPISSTYR